MHTPWPDDIGNVAHQRRLDMNISQEDLAQRVGVSVEAQLVALGLARGAFISTFTRQTKREPRN